MKTEILFTLDGIAGDLRVVANSLSIKLYQNGIEIKKQGSFKPKYKVTKQNGETEEIRVVNNPIQGVVIERNGVDSVHLQSKLTPVEIVLLFVPFIVFIVGCVLFLTILGFLGGLLIGLTIPISLFINAYLLRQYKDTVTQVILSIVVGVVIYSIYAGIGLIVMSLLPRF